MTELNLPPFDVKLKRSEKYFSIWDNIRRKYLVLTPEEWVRQHFVNYIVTEKNYPPALISNEKQITLNNTRRRCDTVVYNSKLQPVVIIEYKAPQVSITQDVFNQIVRYNMVLKVKYLIVSNGMEHYCCIIDYENDTYRYLNEIPDYRNLD